MACRITISCSKDVPTKVHWTAWRKCGRRTKEMWWSSTITTSILPSHFQPLLCKCFTANNSMLYLPSFSFQNRKWLPKAVYVNIFHIFIFQCFTEPLVNSLLDCRILECFPTCIHQPGIQHWLYKQRTPSSYFTFQLSSSQCSVLLTLLQWCTLRNGNKGSD